MKTGAKWSVAFASLSAYKGMGAGKDSLIYLASAIFMLQLLLCQFITLGYGVFLS